MPIIRRLAIPQCLVAVTLVGLAMTPSLAQSPAGATILEPVRGLGCYTYGDNETPAQAKKAAMALAQEQAVKSYRVYVQSASTVKNFQLEDDLIQTASAGMLHDVKIERQEKKDQEICITITAKINPVKLEDLIHQRTKAKDVATQAQAPLLSAGSGFGLKVWTNKQPSEPFVEGESLLISVQSERDAYLKLDYYQADGTVVHLVPNVFSSEAFIKAGKTYTFGGPDSPATFRITGPFGAETIKALASTRPFRPEFSATRKVEDSTGYLRGLRSGVRGIQIESNAAWAEASIGLTTMGKAVAAYTQELGGLRGVRTRPELPDTAKPTPIPGGTGERPVPPTPRP